MNLKPVLTVSAIYLGLLGIGFMFFPRQIGIEAVPADAPPALIAYLRIFGGPVLGIAVLNWLTRNAPRSKTLDAIVIANIIGFGCVAANDVIGVLSGEARQAAKVFLVIHALITIAFILARRTLRQDAATHR